MHLFTLQPSCGFCCLLLWYFDMMDQPTTALPLATLLQIKMLRWPPTLLGANFSAESVHRGVLSKLCQIVWKYESLSFPTASHRFGGILSWQLRNREKVDLWHFQKKTWCRRQIHQCRRGVQVLGLVANIGARWLPGGKVAQEAELPVQQSAGAQICC